jgi:hypothetical protein
LESIVAIKPMGTGKHIHFCFHPNSSNNMGYAMHPLSFENIIEIGDLRMELELRRAPKSSLDSSPFEVDPRDFFLEDHGPSVFSPFDTYFVPGP